MRWQVAVNALLLAVWAGAFWFLWQRRLRSTLTGSTKAVVVLSFFLVLVASAVSISARSPIVSFLHAALILGLLGIASRTTTE